MLKITAIGNLTHDVELKMNEATGKPYAILRIASDRRYKDMLNDFTGADQVYIACGYTDLRKGIDGLARLVQQQFELDPFTNTLFLFCGRRRDRIKGLYWEKDGFILLYKRLEQGAYQWPRSESEVKTLTQQQYRWLMEGLQIEQPKAHHPVTGLTAV